MQQCDKLFENLLDSVHFQKLTTNFPISCLWNQKLKKTQNKQTQNSLSVGLLKKDAVARELPASTNFKIIIDPFYSIVNWPSFN